MAVPVEITKSVNIEGAVATAVEIPVPARGVINRLIVAETTNVGSAATVDVYSQVVDAGDTEADRVPYRVAPRVSTTPANAQAGGLNAVVQTGVAYSYVAGASGTATKKVGKSLSVLITPGAAGTRTFLIALTITDPILQ